MFFFAPPIPRPTPDRSRDAQKSPPSPLAGPARGEGSHASNLADARHWSVRAHLAGRDDGLVRVKPLLDRAPRFADLIESEPDAAAFALIGREPS